jgi:RHS repeat-associated protein
LAACVSTLAILSPSASGESRAKHPATEVTALRTGTSQTFDNGDGTFRREISSQPVRYRSADGRWHPIDTRLRSTLGFTGSTGFGAQTGYAYQNGDGPLKAAFKQSLAAPDAIRVAIGGHGYALGLDNSRAANGSIRGDEIIYRDALLDADVSYAVLPGALKEAVSLNGPNAPSRYSFHIASDDGQPLRPLARLDGSWTVFRADERRPAFNMPAPTVGDAATSRSVEEIANRSAVTLDLKPDGAGIVATLSVDPKWLASSARRFPVIVDPTITLADFSSATSYDAACSNCSLMANGNNYIGTSAKQVLRVLTDFDLGVLPADAQISDAQLKLFSYGGICITTASPCGSTAHALDVHRVITYNGTKPSLITFGSTPEATYTLPADTQDHVMEWGVTALVRAWAAGTYPNNGFLVKRQTEPANAGGPYIDSTGTDGPALVITYTTNKVTLQAPSTLHANGAELSWSNWDGAGAFPGYQIHRSTTAGFTPSATTLLATVGDANTLTFRDTTAASAKSYTYKVVVNGVSSNEHTVTLPAAGLSQKLLSPGPGVARDTYITDTTSSPSEAYNNKGSLSDMYVDGDIVENSLVAFDLSGIPAGSTVTSANLSLYMRITPAASVTVGAHQLTGDWLPGTGVGTQSGDGALWTVRKPGLAWGTPGGDFATAAIATVSHRAGAASGTDTFDLTTLAQKWADGSAPNLGVLLRVEQITNSLGQYLTYDTGDSTYSPAQRPQLAVTYRDGSTSQGPAVSIQAPQGGDTVRGTTTVSAAAGDDRRVDQVQFQLDGANLGAADTSAPFSTAWTTTSATNGAHTLTAKATDDVGNTTTSPGVSVTVSNSALPTTALTDPRPSYVAAVKADNPSVYWRLGELSGTAAADASGNNRPATYAGSFTLGQPSLVSDSDKATRFVNAATDGKATSSAFGGLLGSQLSAEAWVSYTGMTAPGAYDRILSRGWGAAGGWMLGVYQATTGEQRAHWGINAAGTIVTASAPITPGRLHLAGTYDGTTLRLYVNGTETANATKSAAALTTTAAVNVAETLNDDITIDDAAVYGTALSPGSLASHYDLGADAKTTISGAPTIQATASDDVSVARVEFYVDGARFGEDTASPFSATLDTKNPADPVYDGDHTLTTKAYDGGGQVTESSPAAIAVNNTAGSKYQADFTSSPVPLSAIYDPAAGTQETQGIDVAITNRAATALSGTDVALRWRWVSPDPANPTPQAVNGPPIVLGTDLAPGANRTIRANVDPPALPDGVDRAQYTLTLDLYEQSTSTWFADKGNKPLENPVVVNRALQDDLGLERWFQYSGQDIGGGMQHLVNVANGNSLLHWTPWQEPGRGLSTVLDITYNSLEKKSESPLGNNFSLSISSLTRWGNPLDIHPNNADQISGRANRYIEFVDGDGTRQRFMGAQATDGSVYWTEPAGVHLYLRHYSDTDPTRAWALTRPDRTTFFYDGDGYPTAVEDGNRNRLSFTLEDVPVSERTGGPKRRIATVTDASGQGTAAAPNRTFSIDYYSKAETGASHVRGHIQSITDHGGDQALRFYYYDDGNLLRITQAGGSKADGSALADRSFVFTYTTASGSGPAIPTAAARVAPDPKTADESTRLYSVRDPRGHETTFDYVGTGGQDKWKLASRTERDGTRTSWSYDSTARVTTEAAPLTRVTRFAYDTEGKISTITNPLNEVTAVNWTGDRMVHQVSEPTGAYRSFDYNDNGYPTDIRQTTSLNPLTVSRTQLSYEHIAVDASDIAAKWAAGRTTEHISQLKTKTSPRGTETTGVADDFQWDLAYDSAGNLTSVLDPENRAANKRTTYEYDTTGQLTRQTDPNGHVTTYEAYDANGLPTIVRDPKSNARKGADPSHFDYVTRFGYDDDGLLRWTQDANHSAYSGGDPREYRSYFDYDSFHRLGRQSAPKSTSALRGILIWSAADFDANDNLTTEIAAHQGAQYTGAGSRTTHQYDEMDRVTLDTGPDTSADAAGERIAYAYDAAGRLTQQTDPLGVKTAAPDKDHAVIYDYDALDRVTSKTQYSYKADGTVDSTMRQQYCFDLAGNLRSVTEAKGGPAAVTCTPYASASYTTKLTYDDAHRLLTQTDPLGHVQSYTYDADDNVSVYKDEQQLATGERRSYNQRDQLVRIAQPFTATRDVISQYDYDAAGNLQRELSPRAFDTSGNASATDYRTTYQYDENDQQTRIDLPTAADTAATYVHRDYDPNGNLASVSLPVPAADPTQLGPDDKTTLSYFDPGWIRTANDPGAQSSSYDYRPEGWQSSRVAKLTDGTTRTTGWEYYPDGMLQARTDRDANLTRYTYDADNNLLTADSSRGISDVSQLPMHLTAAWDSVDRVAKTRERRGTTGNWKATTFSYDDNDNVTALLENASEDPTTGALTGGRQSDLTYDADDRVTVQVDHGKDSGSAATGDDRRVRFDYFDTDWLKNRTIDRFTAGAFSANESTDRTYTLNGDVTSMVTKNGTGAVRESHDLQYLDGGGRYVDGNRVKDTFLLAGPDSSKRCQSASCTRRYDFDARDRVTDEYLDRDGGTGTKHTQYALDAASNITDLTVDGQLKAKYAYQANQLRTLSVNVAGSLQVARHYFYDADGNMSCVTDQAGGSGDCGAWDTPSRSSHLLEHYGYDQLNRLEKADTWTPGDATKDEDSTWIFDSLDRPQVQRERHGASGGERSTSLDYLGLGNQVTHEVKTGAGYTTSTKDYSYDPYGQRIGLTTQKGSNGAQEFSYGTDVLGSVSLLLDDSGAARAAYGYQAYGDGDSDVTAERDSENPAAASDPQDPTNAYRYTNKRLDPGSGLLDMGARQFSPSIGRFLQRDQYDDALGNLDLATDPLSDNTYSLAGGNPVSNVELDGHKAAGNVTSGDPYATSSGSVRTQAKPSFDRAQSTATRSYSGSQGTARAITRATPRVRRYAQDVICRHEWCNKDQLEHNTNEAINVLFGVIRARDAKWEQLSRSTDVGLADPFEIVTSFGEGALAKFALKVGARAVAGLAAKGARSSFEGLSESAAAGLNDEGLSVAGRSLQKHGGRPGGSLPSPTGNPAAINEQAHGLVRSVLQNSARTRTMSFNKRLGEDVVDIRIPGGIGLRYTREEGRFVGFLEPRR